MFRVQWCQHVRAEITRACDANIIKYNLEAIVDKSM
jgi:hypothetical protein